MSIRILTRDGDQMNAIDQASRCLAAALRERGRECETLTWRPGELARACRHSELLVIPYNPFMWARWGFAPALVRDVAAVRRARPRTRIVLVVHEPYVPIKDLKSFLMGAWQRLQLAALLLLADRRFASIERWARTLSRIRPTAHLPSGSNLPDRRAERAAVRAEHGVGDRLVVATLSTGHPSHLTAYVEEALARLAREGLDVSFFRLGAGSSPVAVPDAFDVVAPGALPAEQLAGLLAAADILLTPFVDGVSTRRGSFMAGLCEAVAVVGTRGELTDPMLEQRGLELVQVGNEALFADRVLMLAGDLQRRAAVAASGRELFEAEFTWGAIADRLLDGSKG